MDASNAADSDGRHVCGTRVAFPAGKSRSSSASSTARFTSVSIVLIFGVIDDLRSFRPRRKFLGQIVVSTFARLACGNGGFELCYCSASPHCFASSRGTTDINLIDSVWTDSSLAAVVFATT